MKNTQFAIERVLQNFTKELLKVFSDAVVQAVGQVTRSGRAALPAPAAGGEAAVEARARRKPGPKPGAKRAKPGPKAKAAKRGPKAKAAKRGRPGVDKSTPQEVSRLGERIVDLLKKSSRNLSAKEIRAQLGIRATQAGRFQYALNKLKDESVVAQHGDRRQARYGLGSGTRSKPRKPGRPKKAAAEAGPAEAAVVNVTEVTADGSSEG